MKCARVTTLIESIWNCASRFVTAWTSRIVSGRWGFGTPKPCAASAIRLASALLSCSRLTRTTVATATDNTFAVRRWLASALGRYSTLASRLKMASSNQELGVELPD